MLERKGCEKKLRSGKIKKAKMKEGFELRLKIWKSEKKMFHYCKAFERGSTIFHRRSSFEWQLMHPLSITPSGYFFEP